MSKKTSSKKTSSKKTASKKTAAPRRPTMSERADAAARAAEALEASNESAVEFTGKTRAFPGAALPPKAKKVAAPKAEKTDKAPRVTVTSVAEDLIRDGKTDEQVLEALTKQFPDFDPVAKKHYPSWYRARLVRSGQITTEFANAHRHAKPSRDIPTRAEA